MSIYDIVNKLVTFFPIQVFIAMSLFAFRFPKRKYFVLRYLLAIALYMISTWFIPNLVVFGWFDLKYILILCISTIFHLLCFDVTLKELIFCALAGYSVQHIGFCLMIIMRINLYGDNNWLNMLIYASSFILTYIVCFFVFARRIRMDRTSNIRNWKLLLLVGITIFITQILSLWLNHEMALNPLPRVYAMACSILVLIVQFDFFRESELERQKDVVEQLLRQRNEQFDISKENIDVINMKVHDIKKNLSLILSSGDQNIRKNMTEELTEAITIYDSEVKTGNEAIDVLIMDRGIYCGKNGIKLSYIVNGALLSFMNTADVFSMIGNMLDNAIERELKENLDVRMISLRVVDKGGCAYVHIENYCSSKVDFAQNGLPVTTKLDKTAHGFGMQSIRFVAEKYGGIVSVYQENDFFNVDVLFIENEKKSTRK